MTAILRAGVASANITPPVGAYLAGYSNVCADAASAGNRDAIAYPGGRSGQSSGVNDDLYARVLVLDDGAMRVALAAVDLLAVDDGLVSRVRTAVLGVCGIPGDHMLLAASHTHSGPGTRLSAPDDRTDAAYLSQVVAAITRAAQAAAQSLAPATIRLGWGEANIGIHRRVVTPSGVLMRPNPAGPVDRHVSVLRVDRAQRQPLAILMHYACHPNVFRQENLLISADYVGAARDVVERSYPGSTALFLQGCSGNIRPNVVGENGDFRSGSEADRQRLGHAVGAAAAEAAEQALPVAKSRLAATSRRVQMPLKSSPLAVPEQGQGIDAEMQAIRLGDVLIITMPGEPFVEIGQRIIQALGERVMVVGYANGYLGYLATARAHAEGGYEVTESPFFEQVEDMLVSTALELAQEVREAPGSRDL